VLSLAILTLGAVFALAQQSSQNVTALYPEDRETWVLEYPAVIAPYVEDYYSCLKGGSYVIGSGRGFETQYRGDIPRCAKKAAGYEQDATKRLATSASGRNMAPGDVAQIFETVRRVHVARGRSLDQTIGTTLRSSNADQAASQAAATAAEPPACVERMRVLINKRAAYVAERGPEIEGRYAKDEFTDEDRTAFAQYSTELSRFTRVISMERSRCPAVDDAELNANATAPRMPAVG